MAIMEQTAEQAKALIKAGQFGEAVETCRKALEIWPNAAELRLCLAQGLFGLGKVEESHGEAIKVIKAEPHNVKARVLLGEVLLRKGQFLNARDALERAAQLDPRNPRIEQLLEEAKLVLDADPRARPQAEVPRFRRPEPPQATSSEELFKPTVVDEPPTQRPDDTDPSGAFTFSLMGDDDDKTIPVNMTSALEELRQHSQALVIEEEVLDLEEVPPPALISLTPAPARYEPLSSPPRPPTAPLVPDPESTRIDSKPATMKIPRASLKQADKPARPSPGKTKPPAKGKFNWKLWTLVILFVASCLGTGAVILWRQVDLRREEEHLLGQAKVAYVTGTFKGLCAASEWAGQALELNKENGQAHALLALINALVQADLGEDRTSLIIEHSVKAKSLIQDSPELTAAKAMVFIIQGEVEEALGYITRSLEIYPNSLEILIVKARALSEKGERDEAVKALDGLIAAHPSRSDLLLLRSRILSLSGKRREALEQLNEIIRTVPAHDAALLERSIILLDIRDRHAEAREILLDLLKRKEELSLGQRGWAYLGLAALNPSEAARAYRDQALQNVPLADPAFQDRVALLYLKEGDLDSAVKHIQKAIDLNGESPLYKLHLGQILLARFDGERALEALDEAPQDDTLTHLAQAKAQYLLGQMKQAQDLLQPLVDQDPSSGEARALLALCHIQGSQLATAEELLKEAESTLEIQLARAQVLMAQDKPKEARSLVQEAMKDYPDSTEAYLLLGQIGRQLQRAEEALTSLQRAVEINPYHFHARLEQGKVLLALGRLEEARGEFTKVLEERAENLTALSSLVRVELAAKSADPAQKAFDALEKVAPDLPETLYLKARLAWMTQNLKQANATLQTLLDLSPQDVTLLTSLGLVRLDQGRAKDAGALFRSAIKLNRSLPLPHIGMGRSWLAIGDGDLAVDELQVGIKALKKRIHSPVELADALAHLGQAYILTGELGKAIVNLQEAVDKNPALAMANFLLGQAHEELNKPERAVVYFAKAVESDPTMAEAYLHLGLGLAHLPQEAKKAIQALEKYMELSPQSPQAKSIKAQILQLKDSL